MSKKSDPIFYYKIEVQYMGQGFFGWQIQTKSHRTLQGELMAALEIICHGKKNIKTVGSGRTDAGVHALGQVVRVDIPLQIRPISLVKALNTHLPEQIRVLSAEVVEGSFRPTSDAQWKEYIYLFTTNEQGSVFSEQLMANVVYDLDIELMNKAAKLFIGTHDFCNFYCEGTDVSTTVRTIYECEIIQERPSIYLDRLFPEYFVFRIKGNGFLKQMVRLMVGVLWEIGRHKKSLEDLEEALKHRKSRKLGPVAPPQGLYLNRVFYGEKVDPSI